MAVYRSIALAFHEATASHPEIADAWRGVSIRIGSLLPGSLLLTSIQREGQVDVLLRAIEEEGADFLRAGEEAPLTLFHNLMIFSTYWISSMYETFRLIKERELVDKSDAFLAIFHQLELVRMGLDKHEIPKDKKLVAPMEMIKIPAGGPEDRYVYDKNDPKRAHIMPTGVSDSGSITWHVIDHINNRHFPVERRAISDQILELWKPKAA